MKPKYILDFPNLISLVRVVLIFVPVYILVSGATNFYLTAFFLIIVITFMDYVDGVVARKLGSTTKFGSVLDIIGDRIVENVLWVAFAYMGAIPLWIPLVVLVRSFIADGFRSYALSRGKTAFGEKGMMSSKVGKFIVSSRFSRGLYAIAKALAFSFLALQLYFIGVSFLYIEIFEDITYMLVLFTVIFGVIRGIFVVYEGLKLFYQKRA